MKYGVLIHDKTKNIGDDIQSYAAACFLPSIDYMVDRDSIDTFKSHNNEKVSVIMSGWWGWKKWNWPPPECIIPKLVGMHIMDYDVRSWGSPIYDEHLNGLGGEYLRCYSPVGCRDEHTLNLLKKHNIDSYFSGCITLTLPKMKKKKSKTKYICLVDVNDEVINKTKKIAKEKNVEVKIITHSLPEGREKMSWEKRSKSVEKLLTIYQNSECVITTRLHAMLPCFAMEIPVLCINDSSNRSRFLPYTNWCDCITTEQFLNNDINIFNLKCNSKQIKKIRTEMINSIRQFIEKTKNGDLKKLTLPEYTNEEKIKWQNQLMKDTLDRWLDESRKLLEDYWSAEDKCKNLENKLWENEQKFAMMENSKGWKMLEKLRLIKFKIFRNFK